MSKKNNAQSTLSGSITGPSTTVLVTSLGSGYIQAPLLNIFDSSSNSGGSGAILQPILSTLSCGIYTGLSTSPLGGTLVANLSPIPIASISSSSIMNMPVQGLNFIGLNSNTNYWAQFSMNVPYSLNANQLLNFINSTGYITQYGYSTDGLNWNTSISSSQIAKLGYVDQGINGTVTSSRGVFLTNDQSSNPGRLQIFIANMDLSSLNQNDLGTTGLSVNNVAPSAPIQNSMDVYVTALNSVTGFQTTLFNSIPKGTTRGSSILLGGINDLYDEVLDVFVVPNLSLGVNFVPNSTVINFTIYDFFTIDSVP